MWSLGKVWSTGGVIPFNKQFTVDGKDIEIYIIDIYIYNDETCFRQYT